MTDLYTFEIQFCQFKLKKCIAHTFPISVERMLNVNCILFHRHRRASACMSNIHSNCNFSVVLSLKRALIIFYPFLNMQISVRPTLSRSFLFLCILLVSNPSSFFLVQSQAKPFAACFQTPIQKFLIFKHSHSVEMISKDSDLSFRKKYIYI